MPLLPHKTIFDGWKQKKTKTCPKLNDREREKEWTREKRRKVYRGYCTWITHCFMYYILHNRQTSFTINRVESEQKTKFVATKILSLLTDIFGVVDDVVHSFGFWHMLHTHTLHLFRPIHNTRNRIQSTHRHSTFTPYYFHLSLYGVINGSKQIQSTLIHWY